MKFGLSYTVLWFDLSLFIFFLVWVRKLIKGFSRNANIWVFSTLRKDWNIWVKVRYFFVLTYVLSRKSRPDDSSEHFLLLVKLSSVCQFLTFIDRSSESSRWPITTSLHPPSSIVRCSHYHSSFINNFISKNTVQI